MNYINNLQPVLYLPTIYPGEMFLPINILNIREYYYISNYGRVYSSYHEKFLSLYKDEESGYVHVSLPMKDTRNYKRIRVHRLMMLIFCYFPGCEELVVNHIDGVKYHNWLWNLEWTTYKGNAEHAWEMGLCTPHPCIGEDHGHAKLNNNSVMEICEKLSKGETATSIAKQYDISRSVVTGIKNRTAWRHISCSYDFSNANNRGLDADIVRIICEKLQDGETPTQISNELGINANNIRNIKKGRTFTNISKNYVFPKRSLKGGKD